MHQYNIYIGQNIFLSSRLFDQGSQPTVPVSFSFFIVYFTLAFTLNYILSWSVCSYGFYTMKVHVFQKYFQTANMEPSVLKQRGI